MVDNKAELTERAGTIFHLVADFRVTLTRHDADQWQALALHRFHMLRALSAFVAFKEEQILVPILCTGDPAAIARAEALKDQNDYLQIEYDAFVLRWGLTSPLSVDTVYKAEAARMISTIEQQTCADVQQLKELIAYHERRSSQHKH
jgi:hypothetical protein